MDDNKIYYVYKWIMINYFLNRLSKRYYLTQQIRITEQSTTKMKLFRLLHSIQGSARSPIIVCWIMIQSKPHLLERARYSNIQWLDYLSLSGLGYVPSMYKQYGEVVSPMGKCKLAHVKPIEPCLKGVAQQKAILLTGRSYGKEI